MAAAPPRPAFEFQRRQLALAAYIRDPDAAPPPPGIEARRLDIYARLVYGNIESFLAHAFSVCHGAVEPAIWQRAVRAFVREHRAASPYFSHIPAEFLAFLGAAEKVRASLPPFALELCHYEWTQFALDLAPDADCRFDDEPVGAADAVALSPLARPLEYAFPVHAIDAGNPPAAPPQQATLVVVWRDRHCRVRVTRVNAATMRLLQVAGDGRAAGECLAAVAAALPTRAAEQVRDAGLEMLDRLHRQDIVLRLATP